MKAFQQAIRQNESIGVKYCPNQDIFEIYSSGTEGIVAVIYLKLGKDEPLPPSTTDDQFEVVK